jgi:hypothetical protein
MIRNDQELETTKERMAYLAANRKAPTGRDQSAELPVISRWLSRRG